MSSSSPSEQRGIFPGLEFFNTLGKIAKKATQEIQCINRELMQPSATHDLQDGTLWTDLHIEYNTAYNQSIVLQQSLSNQSSISESLESFNSMINWIKNETQRIEKQLQQFGYTPNNETKYEYKLPLTPQQQQMYDLQKQQNQMKIDENHNSMDIDHDNDDDDDDDDDDDNNDDDNNHNKESDDDDIDLKHKQESDNKLKLNSKSCSSSNSPNIKNNESEKKLNISAQITPTNITRKPQTMNNFIPSSPKTPALNDKFKLFYRNMRDRNNMNNMNDMNDKENDKENENKMNIESNPSSISTVTPSMSTSAIPKPFGYIDKDRLPETPVLNTKFNMDQLRKQCGITINNKQNNNNSILNDSLGSIPAYLSPKISVKHNINDNINNKKGLAPITPFEINNDSTNCKHKKIASNHNDVTPITVSSFSVRNNNNNDTKQDMDDDDDDNMMDESDDGMSHLTENEFNGIPQWITNQLGSISQINETIDLINNALSRYNGRISKSQIKELIGKNETPFILLLTRTNRLQTDWCQGNSVYCLR